MQHVVRFLYLSAFDPRSQPGFDILQEINFAHSNRFRTVRIAGANTCFQGFSDIKHTSPHIILSVDGHGVTAIAPKGAGSFASQVVSFCGSAGNPLHGPWNAGSSRILSRDVDVIGGGNIIQDAKIMSSFGFAQFLNPAKEVDSAPEQKGAVAAAKCNMPNIARFKC